MQIGCSSKVWSTLGFRCLQPVTTRFGALLDSKNILDALARFGEPKPGRSRGFCHIILFGSIVPLGCDHGTASPHLPLFPFPFPSPTRAFLQAVCAALHVCEDVTPVRKIVWHVSLWGHIYVTKNIDQRPKGGPIKLLNRFLLN